MTTPHPALDWLDQLRLSQPSELHRRLTAVEAQQNATVLAISTLIHKIESLEDRMATAAELVARIDTATNEVASDLRTVRDELAALRDSIPAAQQAAVDSALTALEAPISRLEALGQDPADPVPAPDAPADPAA